MISVGGADSNLKISIVVASIFSYIFVMFFGMLKSAVMALIYTSISMPDQIKEYDKDFVEILDEKKVQMNA